MKITFVDRYYPKLAAPQIIYKKCEGRTFPKCVSLELYALIGIEILSSNI